MVNSSKNRGRYPIRNSLTDPIILNPIAKGSTPANDISTNQNLSDSTLHENPAILYQSLAPGKKKKSSKSKSLWDRDLNLDLIRIKHEYRVSHIVSLLEPEEAANLSIAHYGEMAAYHGLVFISYPVRDNNIPSDIVSFHQLILTIRKLLDSGHSVMVNCMGGLGRSGTVTAATLISCGYSAKPAILWVQQQRKGSLTNKRQQKFLENYEKYISNH